MEVALEDLIEPLLCCLPHPKRLRDGREEQFGFGEGGERHEESTVGEVLKQVRCCLQGEPCLTGPARTGEGEQARRLAAQEVAHLRYLLLAPDQRRRLEGEVVAVGIERPKQWEIRRQL